MIKLSGEQTWHTLKKVFEFAIFTETYFFEEVTNMYGKKTFYNS